MKRRKIKRGGAGILAIALACGMVFTSFGSLTTYADEEHYDTVAPVIDDVNVDDLKQIYAQGENVTFKVHAYDEGGSGMEHMEMQFNGQNVEDETQTDHVRLDFYFNNSEYTYDGAYSYDESTGYYTFTIPVSRFKMGYSYKLNSLYACDGVSNYVYADEQLINDKVTFSVENKKNDSILIQSLAITDEKGKSVIGETIDNSDLHYTLTLNNSDDIDTVSLEFKPMCDGSYENSIITCYKEDGNKFVNSGCMPRQVYGNDIVEYRLVSAFVRYDNGKKENISLADGFDDISISLNPEKFSPIENKFTVE